MLQALIDGLADQGGPCQVDVLTTYPLADALEPPADHGDVGVSIISYRPRELVFPLLPLALLAFVADRLGAPGRLFRRTPALRSLSDADVVVDLAGISFADGRGIPVLVYNVLMTGIPLLLGCCVVKCSQALGPFRRPLNRWAATAVLTRVQEIVARGQDTMTHLDALQLPRVSLGADLAFTLRVGDGARAEALRLAREAVDHHEYVALVPSEVVRRYCAGRGIDYVAVLRDFVRRLLDDGERVIILAHATRTGRGRSRMNDLPLIETIATHIDSPELGVLDRSLPPDVLRALVGHSTVTVTGRFHAMISALAEGTPVLVTGWSHKYAEVLREFDLEDWAQPYDELDADSLYARYRALRSVEDEVTGKIRGAIERQRGAAGINFEAIERGRAVAGSRR